MNEEYTMTRIRRDVLRKLKAIAEREKRTVASQIAYMVEREESTMAITEPTAATTHPQVQR